MENEVEKQNICIFELSTFKNLDFYEKSDLYTELSTLSTKIYVNFVDNYFEEKERMFCVKMIERKKCRRNQQKIEFWKYQFSVIDSTKLSDNLTRMTGKSFFHRKGCFSKNNFS